jgi:predicted porin
MAASAQSNTLKTSGNWEFYGRAHISMDKLEDGNKYDRVNVSSNSSRVGFRGDKSFGELKGIWQIESEILFTNNASDNSSTGGAGSTKTNYLASRDTFGGVEGSFGTVKFGKFDTPFKVAREAANLFGDQLGDMRNITRTGAKFDERPNNIVQYQSPEMSGLRLTVAYAPHEGAAAATSSAGVETNNAMGSASISYNAGDVSAALAYEGYEKDASSGQREATRLAVSYKLNSNLKLAGFYQDAKYMSGTTDNGSKVTGFGVEYQIIPNHTVLRAHVMDRQANRTGYDSKMTAIGIDRIISKELRFYANYAVVSNGTSATVTPWVEGRSTSAALVPGSSGKDATGISLGMRYDF